MIRARLVVRWVTTCEALVLNVFQSPQLPSSLASFLSLFLFYFVFYSTPFYLASLLPFIYSSAPPLALFALPPITPSSSFFYLSFFSLISCISSLSLMTQLTYCPHSLQNHRIFLFHTNPRLQMLTPLTSFLLYIAKNAPLYHVRSYQS